VLEDLPGQEDMAVGKAEKGETVRMNKYGIKNHIIISFFAIGAALPSNAFCQADTLTKPAKEYPVQNKSPQDIHSLYTGIGAGSNMIYLGTSISNNKPFYSASITYGYRNTLYASASASHLSETTPYLAFYNLAMNYRHTFNSWFDISTDIAGYKTAESLQDSLFADFVFINLTLGFDWKILYTRISFSELFSEENGFFLQISNSRYFETPEFFDGKALVYFDPDFDILFGNLVNVETVSGNMRYRNAPPFSHARKKPMNSSRTYSEKFGLMDLEFSLPVTFSYGKFSIEAQVSYLLPIYSNPDYPEPKGFTFYLNAIFKIF
jgi:hypothetical protein